MDAAPFQPIEEPLNTVGSSAAVAIDPAVLEELWLQTGARDWGLARGDCERIILLAAMRQNFGLGPGVIAGKEEQVVFFSRIKLADLVLAHACAEGNERAWEHFMHLFGAQLTRAAIAISGSETVGRDLADSFYGELYGLNTHEGQRKCPLESYRGRGSLIGWLRTTLSQRFIDHYRRTFREEALNDNVHDVAMTDVAPKTDDALSLTLGDSIRDVLSSEPAEERFVLAAYYLDGKTLAEIGRVLHVHEATISRRLKRSTEAVRKRLLKSLEKRGMSHRAAEEALGTDPRDLDLRMDLRKLLQYSSGQPFSEQDVQDPSLGNTKLAEPLIAQTQTLLSPDTGGEK